MPPFKLRVALFALFVSLFFEAIKFASGVSRRASEFVRAHILFFKTRAMMSPMCCRSEIRDAFGLENRTGWDAK
jgi:hypothetical protein